MTTSLAGRYTARQMGQAYKDVGRRFTRDETMAMSRAEFQNALREALEARYGRRD